MDLLPGHLWNQRRGPARCRTGLETRWLVSPWVPTAPANSSPGLPTSKVFLGQRAHKGRSEQAGETGRVCRLRGGHSSPGALSLSSDPGRLQPWWGQVAAPCSPDGLWRRHWREFCLP